MIRKPDRFSYVVILLLFVLMVWLHLASLLLAVLFSFLALQLLRFGSERVRWLAVILFIVLISAGVYSLTFFTRHAMHTLPDIANKAIPSIIGWAHSKQIELPFADYESLREMALDAVQSLAYVGSFAKFAGVIMHQALFVLAGVVIAISIFLHPRAELSREPKASPNNLYTRSCEQLAERFRTLYESFATVMGAQIVISAINTLLTGIFALAVDLPYAYLIVGVTFLCGLLPVIGNLISNTVIVGIGFTVSPQMALTALVFLVVIHKLEYFLNSTIIGYRIRNPLWITLAGLIVGERLLGIPGIILAPVILNYVKREASKIELPQPGPAVATPDPGKVG